MTVSVIGAGPMGRAIAHRYVIAGERVMLLDLRADRAARAAARTGAEVAADVHAALRADIVTLALGGHRDVLDFVTAYRSELAGLVLVDTTNPVHDCHPGADPAGSLSIAERLALAAPETSVVKAFNTLCASALLTGRIDDAQPDVFVASDDDVAKATVIEIVDRSGLRGLDSGGLRNARVLEQMAVLCIEIVTRLDVVPEAAMKFLPNW
ncbi:NADPH-dependent F420 reductase [Microbispora siamensis]|uniref:NADPH-dependent F420 reductase n=1 Tax=Microbispora siamensis TaxID=564413 RepID=A0ABQ4GJT7_9ACTN|nr:NAD(P)-binding domain-containing protein [Microbispora siamensis]GIH61674.1 NADPH-dependent F420 reductase [Microbispora siamensis]